LSIASIDKAAEFRHRSRGDAAHRRALLVQAAALDRLDINVRLSASSRCWLSNIEISGFARHDRA
jgi:hypothetical protein